MESMLQDLVVMLLVLACTGYAAWKVMPAAARRALAVTALGWPTWPAAWRVRLERVAKQSGGGCGCDGCDQRSDARPASGNLQPITLHRRKPVG